MRVGKSMKEIILDLGPVNSVDETAFAQAIEQLAEWFEMKNVTVANDRDAPDLMIKTVCDSSGTLRKSVIFQKQEWANAFMNFWDQERAAS